MKMEYRIHKSLNRKKQQILLKWQPEVYGSHISKDPAAAQKSEGRFTNPFGYVIEKNTAEMLDWLFDNENKVDLNGPLEEICRHKALQDGRPSEALSFIFALKPIIRKELRDEGHGQELLEIDKRIDEMALLAFDIYSDCRARICEIKMNEIKRMYGRESG